jgi:hypothetical protein
MNCERIQELLQARLDGELAATERGELERHLAGCAECRGEAAAFEAVMERAKALPRGIDPGRDLWPAVESRLEPRRGRLLSFGAPRPRYVWLAAAATVALVLGLSLNLLSERWRQGDEPVVATATGRQPATDLPSEIEARAGLARKEDGTQHSRIDLEVTVELRRDVLSEEVLADLDENLRILDAAVAELRSALDEDPWNRRLSHQLAARYQQEAEIAQQMQRI